MLKNNLFLFLGVLILALVICGTVSAESTVRADRGPAGLQSAGGDSWLPVISDNGRYVVYQSEATNLVSGDTNTYIDVFLYDNVTKSTIRANRGPNGLQANGPSSQPAISGNGRYVVYQSNANNLVTGDTNNVADIFLYDTLNKITTRVNRGPNGAQATGGDSWNPDISYDGRYIVYQSSAKNLVPGDTNNFWDIFLYDTVTKTTTRVNRGPNGAQASGGSSNQPAISGNGRYVVYTSSATNLVSSDTNNEQDIFLYDTVTKTTIRANRGPNGAQATGGESNLADISSDGRYIVYYSYATNLVTGDTNNAADIFLYDTATKSTIRANRGPNGLQANAGSYSSKISSSGRYVVYYSDANNLVSVDNNSKKDIFLYDTVTKTTIMVSKGLNGAQTTDQSFNPAVSSDGRYVVYNSMAANIVNGDTNGLMDVFLYSRN